MLISLMLIYYAALNSFSSFNGSPYQLLNIQFHSFRSLFIRVLHIIKISFILLMFKYLNICIQYYIYIINNINTYRSYTYIYI